jgi:hypothetical protein
MAPDLKRVVSGVGAVLLSLLGLVLSLGVILGALLGIWFMTRWAKRRGRQASPVAELVAAVFSATVLAGLLWSAVFAAAPAINRAEFQSALSQKQSKPRKLPDWYSRAFPQSAQMDSATRVFSDSVTRKLARSDAFPHVMIAFGVLMLAMMFGGVGGVTGWGARQLFISATRKDRPPERS